MRVVGILLAAGRGTRFGGDKLLAPLPAPAGEHPAGTAIGIAAALNLRAALPEAVAVVRPGASLLAARLRDAGLRTVECPGAERGMGVTLACGVKAVPDADAWVIALADMPWVAPSTIAALVSALARGADIAAPVRCGRRGNPVGFAARHRDALMALSGDEGARALVAALGDRVTLVEVDDPGIARDVDTPGDLGGGEATHGGSSPLSG